MASPSLCLGLHSCHGSHHSHQAPSPGPGLLQGNLAQAVGRIQLYFLGYFLLKQELLPREDLSPSVKLYCCLFAATYGLVWSSRARGMSQPPRRE